jgi:hypothetical protein
MIKISWITLSRTYKAIQKIHAQQRMKLKVIKTTKDIIKIVNNNTMTKRRIVTTNKVNSKHNIKWVIVINSVIYWIMKKKNQTRIHSINRKTQLITNSKIKVKKIVMNRNLIKIVWMINKVVIKLKNNSLMVSKDLISKVIISKIDKMKLKIQITVA